ncbi:putative 4-coumarate--CoA ligase-like 8 [Yarrowia sp. B02]|nr:putative 4-coumarate--CoA ligase-like 8 [Yarrowia sp. B02]
MSLSTNTSIHHASRVADVPLKDTFRGNVTDFVRSGGFANDDSKPCCIDAKSGKELTQKQVWDYADRFRALLHHDNGLCPFNANTTDPALGDVMITLVPNHLFITSLHFAALDLGATVSPGSAGYTVAELVNQINLTGASLIVYTRPTFKVVREALAQIVTPVKIVEFETLIERAEFVQNHMVQSTKKLALSPEESYSRIAYLGMSSGTSGGLPKAVRLSHFNMVSSAELSKKAAPSIAGQEQIAGAIIPVNHVYGLAKFLIAMPKSGATTVFHSKFDLIEILDAQQKYKVNMYALVPPIIVVLAKHPAVEKYIPSLRQHLRYVSSGAAPLGANVIEACNLRLAGTASGENEFGGLKIVQGYGLTETSPVVSTFDPNDPERHARSCGKLVPNTQARIVSEDGLDQPAYELDLSKLDAELKKGNLPTGELWLRGPQIMDGYHKNDAANAESFVDATDYTPDMPFYMKRWFRTGDVALVDTLGRYMIVDRTKEMIKSMSKQVAPAELEDILLGHPQVADAAVIGVQQEEKGTEAPRAFVVLRDPKFDAVEVKTWMDKQVPKYKQLHGGIVVLDAVPKNASGKILRRILRQREGDVVVGVDKAKL